MRKLTLILPLLAATTGLSACGVTPYVKSPNTVIATNHDTGFSTSHGALKKGDAAVAYDPSGCQVWIMDDGVEGYAGRRYDPVSGLPVCDHQFPPGTVVGNYQTSTTGIADWVPTH